MVQTIQYGIGKEYLKDWGLNEALREIYQNFIDFGEYDEKVLTVHNNPKKGIVYLSNDFDPEDFSFLKIGKSIKHSEDAIGKHGEGLKMAFLILLRLGYKLKIKYKDICITSNWNTQNLIGETLELKVEQNTAFVKKFTVIFTCPIDDFKEFRNNIITEDDVIFKTNYHGSIVNKPAGNLYSGSLFVCHLKNLKKSYNLNPQVLHLDRDRRIPGAFNVSYHTSKINEAEAEINFVDQTYDDYQYIQKIPEPILKTVRAKAINGKVEFVATVTNEETKEKEEILITNQNIKETLKSHSFFTKAINGIKNYLAAKLGIKDLLIAFRDKHCLTKEAKIDFDIIIGKLGIVLPE